jgi:uncharacterized protein
MRGLGAKAALLLCVVTLIAASPADLTTSASPVADAARNGDREIVRTLLQKGGDVNAAEGDGMTALHWAARSNDVQMAEMLLYAGANLKAATRLGSYTPLDLASRLGNVEVTKVLLDSGADVGASTSTGLTPLMMAARSGSTETVRLLLDHQADVNAKEPSHGQTALMFAAALNRTGVVDLLLERGADAAASTKVVDIPELDKEHKKALDARLKGLREQRTKAAAASAKDAKGASAKGAKNDVGATDDERPKANDNVKAKAKADKTAGAPTEDEDDGTGPKPAGKKSEDKNLFAKLFGWMTPDKPKEIRDPNGGRRFRRPPFGDLVGVQGGMTALLLAAREGNDESVRALLKAGADVNQVAEGSKTSPLLIATMNGHWDLASYLLDQGADPTLANEPAGVTPLYAVINLQWAPFAQYPQPTAQLQQKLTHLELMKALLDKGADPNVRLKKKVWFSGYNFDTSGVDEAGATPFWRAAYGSDVPAMALLKEYGADPSIATMAPPARPRVGGQEGREIKDVSGLPPVPVGGPSLTPLHAASGAGFGEGFAANDYHNSPAGFMPAVKYLVEECGADVNARDAEGNTPLHDAASRGDVEMIQYLVSKGADVTLVNREGQTTADMANGPVQRIQPFPEALELLVSLGAKNSNKCVSC